MDDLISRKAAIEAVHEEFDECLVWDESGKCTADEVEIILESLPSAQPDNNMPTQSNTLNALGKNDCVSRQAAIEATCKACSMEGDYHKCDGYPETSAWCDELVALRSVPSARPLDPCETCLHKGKGWDEDPCDGCTRNDSKYEPERKKWEWIPVKFRPMDSEEREYLEEQFGEELADEDAAMFDCPMPEDGQEILVSYRKWISMDKCEIDGGCYGLEGNGDWEDVVAWMPLPEPYREEE